MYISADNALQVQYVQRSFHSYFVRHQCYSQGSASPIELFLTKLCTLNCTLNCGRGEKQTIFCDRVEGKGDSYG